jgi:2-polyprenyl-3-methyl-5-hydroxy-6-metoxy-1,4-benzoquinol methylase
MHFHRHFATLTARSLRLKQRLRTYTAALRDELILGRARPQDWAWLTARAYNRNPGYHEPTYNTTLYDWERAAFSDFFPPPPARILVGACGAGREMFALARLGYQVAGFDPAERLVERCRTHVPEAHLLQCWVQSYEQFALAPPSRLAGTRFDAGVIGFGSFAHLACSEDRRRVLDMFRQLCRGGPLLMSWVARGPSVPQMRVRRALQRLRLSAARAGDFYTANEGLMHHYDFEEICRIVHDANYRIVRYNDEQKFPYAVICSRARVGRCEVSRSVSDESKDSSLQPDHSISNAGIVLG